MYKFKRPLVVKVDAHAFIYRDLTFMSAIVQLATDLVDIMEFTDSNRTYSLAKQIVEECYTEETK